ncbi:MAG TPA: LemA family protein [Kofleriaceae bacterium]|nr:LemA family protein [Kofleriaceae bacterium]
MKKWIPLAVIGGIVLILVLFGVSRYNALVTANERVDGAWANVESKLQRRLDLIPNLVETVKGFAAQEKEVFTSIAEARAKLAGAQTPDQEVAAHNELSSALSRLLVVVERYPELKSNQNFIRLQDELAGTENRISVERDRYNEAVTEFNSMIKRFPNNIFAGIAGLDEREQFKAEAAAKEAPKVDFGTGK